MVKVDCDSDQSVVKASIDDLNKFSQSINPLMLDNILRLFVSNENNDNRHPAPY